MYILHANEEHLDLIIKNHRPKYLTSQQIAKLNKGEVVKLSRDLYGSNSHKKIMETANTLKEEWINNAKNRIDKIKALKIKS